MQQYKSEQCNKMTKPLSNFKSTWKYAIHFEATYLLKFDYSLGGYTYRLKIDDQFILSF